MNIEQPLSVSKNINEITIERMRTDQSREEEIKVMWIEIGKTLFL